MNFKTKIDSRNVSIWTHPKVSGMWEDGYEIEDADFTVLWACEIEAREWGVKDISCIVTGIEGQFDIAYFDEEGDEKKRETIEFDFEPFKNNTTFDAEMVDRQISIEDLDIDYSDHSVTVR